MKFQRQSISCFGAFWRLMILMVGLCPGGVGSAGAAICTWTGSWDITPSGSSDSIIIQSGGDLTWGFTQPHTVASWIQAGGYAGTVTIETRYDTSFPSLVITGNCQILGGTWTHPIGSSGNTEIFRLRVEVGGDFTLANGAIINLDQKGFAAQYYGGYGPGRTGFDSNYERGASHGGLGGRGQGNPNTWDKVYGSITSPTNLGSSANYAGGGALYLTVEGTVTVDGVITATSPNSGYIAAAAGGSVFIMAGALTGSGTIDVSGAAATGGGGAGGGGRIAVILRDTNTFGSVNLKAYGGWAGIPDRNGAAGTIYRQTSTQAEGRGTVTIDNNNMATITALTMVTPTEWDLTLFSQVILTNRGFLALNTNTALDWVSQTNLTTYGPDQSLLMAQNTNFVTLSSSFFLSGFGLTLYTNLAISGDLVVSNGSLTLATGYRPNLWVGGNLVVATNGTISHWPGAETYRLVMQVGGDLTIAGGGGISADGKGFPPGGGPGRGDLQNANTCPAASHGGLGAPKPGVSGQPVTYGSMLAPTNYGSGGTVYGGGSIQISVARTATVQGVISARAGVPGLAASAGGSIFLTTGWLQGSGTMDVSSPDFYPSSAQYGGGGGRISVVLSNGVSFGSVAMKAYGCYPGRTAPFPGAAGTIFKRTSKQGPGYGTLLVDNRNVVTSTNITTQVPPVVSIDPAAQLRWVTLVATNSANVELVGDAILGDLYLCDGNSRLRLNGYTLILKSLYHDDWGHTNRVVYDGGKIIWTLPAAILMKLY